MRTHLQRFARSMLGPLPVIIVAGFLLGLSSIIGNGDIVGETIANTPFIQTLNGGISAVVGNLFGILPILFAVSVALGLAEENKETAAYSAVIGFIVFHVVINYLLGLNNITPETTNIEYLLSQGLSEVEAIDASSAYEYVLGIFTYRMGIFGGIIIGLWTTFIHERYHKKQLPVAFAFFSGTRLVPIMMILTVPLLSIISYFIWPLFGSLINGLGHLIANAGTFGAFLYGFSERLLIPTGLHHVLNQLIRFTPIGGVAEIGGEIISGAFSIYSAAIDAPVRNIEIIREGTKFLDQGYHPFMLFGLPAAAYAMYTTAEIEQKPKIKGMLLAAAVTSFAAGITEPIEFSFIFISPLLFIFHAVMAGLSFLIMNVLNVAVGNSAGGVFSFLIFGPLQGNWTRWYIIIIVGIIYAIVYYQVFKYVILKQNLATPGREGARKSDDRSDETTEFDSNQMGEVILSALGGPQNILDVDNCISRLRLVLNDTSIVNKEKLKDSGAMGVIIIDDQNIQVVYGANVENASNALKDQLRRQRE